MSCQGVARTMFDMRPFRRHRDPHHDVGVRHLSRRESRPHDACRACPGSGQTGRVPLLFRHRSAIGYVSRRDPNTKDRRSSSEQKSAGLTCASMLILPAPPTSLSLFAVLNRSRPPAPRALGSWNTPNRSIRFLFLHAPCESSSRFRGIRPLHQLQLSKQQRLTLPLELTPDCYEVRPLPNLSVLFRLLSFSGHNVAQALGFTARILPFLPHSTAPMRSAACTSQ